MRTLRKQTGEIQIGAIFWIVLLIAGAVYGKEYVPLKIATMQLKDYAEELCQLSPRGTAEEYRDAIFSRATQLDLPVEKKDIKITKSLKRAVIEIEFQATLDLIVTERVSTIEIFVDRDIFLM